MVKMILNLMALEEGLNNINHYMDHLGGKFPEFGNDPLVANIKDRLQIMEVRLQETISQWPQLGVDTAI